MANLKTEVRQLISDNQLESALQRVSEYAESTDDNELSTQMVLLKSRYSRAKQNELLQIMTYTESLRERAVISHSLMDIVNRIRLVEEPEGKEGKAIDKPKKEGQKVILFLASNPIDYGRLQLEKEFVLISTRLQDRKDKFRLYVEWAETPRDLQKAMIKHKPNYVHFSGHGREGAGKQEGILIIGNDHQTKIVNTTALANMFKIFKSRFNIELVVLNACYSESQALAINEHVPNVIGMKDSVDDETALEFSIGFYLGIADGDDIDFSFELARNSIELEGLSGEDLPVLLSKN